MCTIRGQQYHTLQCGNSIRLWDQIENGYSIDSSGRLFFRPGITNERNVFGSRSRSERAVAIEEEDVVFTFHQYDNITCEGWRKTQIPRQDGWYSTSSETRKNYWLRNYRSKNNINNRNKSYMKLNKNLLLLLLVRTLAVGILMLALTRESTRNGLCDGIHVVGINGLQIITSN